MALLLTNGTDKLLLTDDNSVIEFYDVPGKLLLYFSKTAFGRNKKVPVTI